MSSKTYQFIFSTAPLFVFQWLFDEAQMRADSVGAPVTPQQWDYIHEMGGALRTSLDNVTAVFAPACIGHSVLTKRDWQNIKIDDVSLTDSLRCWENSLVKDHKIMLKLVDHKKSKQNENKKKNRQSDQPQLTLQEKEQRRKERRRLQRLTPEEREQKKLERRERRRQEKLLQKMEAKNQTPRALRSPQEIEISNENSLPKIIENAPDIKQQQKKRRQHRRRQERLEARNATRVPKHHKRNQQKNLNTQRPNKRRHGEHNRHKLLKAQNQLIDIKEPKKCGLRMLERCSWPQCNHSCPTLTNPLTGEEMKFLELLTSFGLDIYAVAQALGVDMQTLNNMDHKELIKLFTESAS